MILFANAENTETLIGCAEEKTGEIIFRNTVSTDVRKTADEYAVTIGELLRLNNPEGTVPEGGIVSSCVPPLTDTLKSAMRRFAGAGILEVGPGIKTGVDIRIDDPAELGADLITTAAAGIEKYGAPLVIVSLNTLTTLSVINDSKQFAGAIFTPGIRLSADALTKNTACLPAAAIRPSTRLIGANTIESIQSGVLNGCAAMIDGLVTRIEEELGLSSVKVVMTGPSAGTIMRLMRTEAILSEDLAAEGLIIIYNRNRRLKKRIKK